MKSTTRVSFTLGKYRIPSRVLPASSMRTPSSSPRRYHPALNAGYLGQQYSSLSAARLCAPVDTILDFVARARFVDSNIADVGRVYEIRAVFCSNKARTQAKTRERGWKRQLPLGKLEIERTPFRTSASLIALSQLRIEGGLSPRKNQQDIRCPLHLAVIPTAAVYITLSELTGRFPSKDELTGLVEGMSARTAAAVALRLNTIFRRCTVPDPADMFTFQNWVANHYFDQGTRAELLKKFGNASPLARPLFHPLQLLYLAKLAITLGRDDAAAREENLDDHTSEFGRACLMINDLFCTPEERQAFQTGSQDEKSKELMIQLLASGELSNPTPIRNLFIRSFVTYGTCLTRTALPQSRGHPPSPTSVGTT
jgi:hypothetical protein